jgi:hypothetical protein
MPAKKKVKVSDAECNNCPWKGPYLNVTCPLCGSTSLTVYPVVEKVTPRRRPSQKSKKVEVTHGDA